MDADEVLAQSMANCLDDGTGHEDGTYPFAPIPKNTCRLRNR